jgi:hypothetical protein
MHKTKEKAVRMHQEDKREKEQNAVCLDSTFDLLVSYGMLKAEDAQCFRVEAKLESAAYLLACGAMLVAQLNTYVGNASKQYFHDVDNKSFKEALLVPKSLSDSNHSTQRRDEDNLTRADTSTARESYIKTRPGLESRGNSFNDEDIRGEEEFLLAGNPLDPPPSDKDPLAPPAVDGDEVDHSWRTIPG